MRTKKEGFNTFSEFDTIQIAVDFPKRGKKINSFQIIFGGHATFDNETWKKDNREYIHGLKKFFYNRVKDGYYKERFLLIDGTPNSVEKNKSGLIFHEVFFFLEEEYDKSFVIDYMKGVFNDLNQYHRDHSRIKFKKYKHYKQDRFVEC